MRNFASSQLPWEYSPNSLVSLLQMLIFYADAFVKAQSEIQRIHQYGPMYKDKDQQWVDDTRAALGNLKAECERVNFDSLVAQIDRVGAHVGLSRIMEITEPGQISAMRSMVSSQLDDIVQAVKYELSRHVFLHISNDRKAWYSEEDQPLFGHEVACRFPNASHDIAEAGRCFALERWDACVYHLMLATERALRKWARTLKVKKTNKPLELMDWKPILDAATARLNVLKGKAGSNTKKAKEIELIAEKLSHFGLIKEAYRNVCAHGRSSYDERKARNILNHVQAFMQSLSKVPHD